VTRFVAVDWSGARVGAERKIWLAEVRDRQLVRLECGRNRNEVTRHLIDDARGAPDVVVGFDFAFAFPAWFAREHEAETVEDVWRVTAQCGEGWLRDCSPPFWGRPGKSRPRSSVETRRTETDVTRRTGVHPKSVFQIGGAGTVGTGSIRGMPCLTVLRDAGFSVWPFHVSEGPRVLEIYPRLMTGDVVKSRRSARAGHLVDGFPEIGDRFSDLAASSDDAFDAAISAVIMARHGAAIARLIPTADPVERLEGRIWWPGATDPSAR
jgi:hypothetical protein